MKVNGKRIDEHRLIMEEYLGRKLSRNEVVHHINGNKKDNRIVNLEVMNLSEHSRKEMKGNTHSPVKKHKGELFLCPGCNLYLPRKSFNKNKNSYFKIETRCKKCRSIIWKNRKQPPAILRISAN